jgi:hypothetical protein
MDKIFIVVANLAAIMQRLNVENRVGFGVKLEWLWGGMRVELGRVGVRFEK